jgi:hypothetical protein
MGVLAVQANVVQIEDPNLRGEVLRVDIHLVVRHSKDSVRPASIHMPQDDEEGI